VKTANSDFLKFKNHNSYFVENSDFETPNKLQKWFVNIQKNNFQKIQNHFVIKNYYSNFLKLHITILQVYFSDDCDWGEKRPYHIPAPHSNISFGYRQFICHMPLGLALAAAKDSAALHIHSNRSINTRRHPTHAPLGKVFARALVVPSSFHQRVFVCVGRAQAAQVGVSLVSSLNSLFKQSRLHCSQVCLTWNLWPLKNDDSIHIDGVHHAGAPPCSSCPVCVLCLFSSKYDVDVSVLPPNPVRGTHLLNTRGLGLCPFSGLVYDLSQENVFMVRQRRIAEESWSWSQSWRALCGGHRRAAAERFSASSPCVIWVTFVSGATPARKQKHALTRKEGRMIWKKESKSVHLLEGKT